MSMSLQCTSSQSETTFSGLPIGEFAIKVPTGVLFRKFDSTQAVKINTLLTGSIPSNITEVLETVEPTTVVRRVVNGILNYVTY